MDHVARRLLAIERSANSFQESIQKIRNTVDKHYISDESNFKLISEEIRAYSKHEHKDYLEKFDSFNKDLEECFKFYRAFQTEIKLEIKEIQKDLNRETVLNRGQASALEVLTKNTEKFELEIKDKLKWVFRSILSGALVFIASLVQHFLQKG